MNENRRYLTIGFTAAFVHWLILVIIQVENIYTSIGIEKFPDLYHHLGLIQGENLIITGFIGIVIALGYHYPISRWLCFAGIILLNLFLVFDQIGYKVFFDHFRFSFVEHQEVIFNRHLLGSVRQEMDAIFYANVVLLVSTSLLLFYLFYKKPPNKDSTILPPQIIKRLPHVMILSIAIGITLDWNNVNKPDYYNINHHALFTLWHDIKNQSLAANQVDNHQPRPFTSLSELQQPQFGNTPVNNNETAQFSKIQQRQQQLKQPLNILLVVLESVGSIQMFDENNRPSKNLTPHIHQLSKNALIYPAIYAPFPATIRSMLSLNTGGHNLTTGSVFEEFNYQYTGPSLANHFKEAGFTTALFSSASLDFENQYRIYAHDSYDHYYDFGDTNKRYQKRNRLNSWGGNETSTIHRIIEWLDQPQAKKQPFFIQYLTNATHHPYGVPKAYAKSAKRDRKSRYQQALRYTDEALGLLLNKLEKSGLLANTVIAITGDHGEAFAQRHDKNLTHKHFLYEENVKSFLLLSNPQLFSNTLISHRVGSMGDILPSLFHFTGKQDLPVIGQNLLSLRYQNRIQFFHKSAYPKQWGLRDGQWKYIESMQNGETQLFDLSQDPTEQYSLAHQYPNKIAIYHDLAARWMISSHQAYTDQLENFHATEQRPLRSTELTQSGPKILSFGIRNANDQFLEKNPLSPNDNVVAQTSWVAYGTAKNIRYEWLSPNGQQSLKNFVVKSDWTTTNVHQQAEHPLEEGRWQLTLWDGQSKLLSGTFQVDKQVKQGASPQQAHLSFVKRPSGSNKVNQTDCKFDVIAHRGSSFSAPENTLYAIDRALTEGATIVEVDLHLSKDHIPVLLHDQRVDRTTQQTGRADRRTLAELKQLDAGRWHVNPQQNLTIPSLAEAITAVAGRGALYLDIKSRNMAVPIKRVLDAHRFPPNSIYPAVSSISMMKEYRSVLPNTPLVWFGGVPKRWSKAWFDTLKQNNVIAIELFWTPLMDDLATINFAQAARKQGFALWTFVINDSNNIKQILPFGVDGIETNLPGSLHNIVCQQGEGYPLPKGRISGQWDFKHGNLTASIGSNLMPWGELNKLGDKIKFGNTKTFQLPAINQQIADIIYLPAFPPNTGLQMFPGLQHFAPGSGHYSNNYTLIMDILRPTQSANQWIALLQSNDQNRNDADLFINPQGRVGISDQYFGMLEINQWHRLAMVVATPTHERSTMYLYLNGQAIGQVDLNGIDGRWSLESTLNTRPTLLFTDDNSQTAPIFINSLQIRDYAMSADEVETLQGPQASGIRIDQ